MSPVTGATTVGATVGPGDESDDRAPTVGAGTGSGEGLGDGSGDRGAGTGADPDASGARPSARVAVVERHASPRLKTSPRIHVPTLSSAATERRHRVVGRARYTRARGAYRSRRGHSLTLPADPCRGRRVLDPAQCPTRSASSRRGSCRTRGPRPACTLIGQRYSANSTAAYCPFGECKTVQVVARSHRPTTRASVGRRVGLGAAAALVGGRRVPQRRGTTSACSRREMRRIRLRRRRGASCPCRRPRRSHASCCAPIDADVSAACQCLCGVETSIPKLRHWSRRLRPSTPPSRLARRRIRRRRRTGAISSSRNKGASISAEPWAR